MKLKIILFLSLLFILPSVSFSEETKQTQSNPGLVGIEIEGRYWMPTLSSTINMGNGIPGTDIDVISDLGIDKDQQLFQGKFILKVLKRHNFRLSYIPLSLDSNKVITRSINFKGREYTVNTAVNSSLDVDFFKIGYGFDIISNPMGSLGLFIDLLHAEVSAKISAPDLGISASGSASGYSPAIGARGRVYLIPNRLSLTGELAFAKLSDIASYVETEASIDFSIIENLGISAGYKTIDLEAEKGNDKGDLTLRGPYFAAFFRF